MEFTCSATNKMPLTAREAISAPGMLVWHRLEVCYRESDKRRAPEARRASGARDGAIRVQVSAPGI